MNSKSSEGTAEGDSDPAQLLQLKQFSSPGKGFWSDVSDHDWNNWIWQLKNRITTLDHLQRLMPTLTPEEYAGTALANKRLALGITPYFFNLIDPADELCAIRRQVVPRIDETHTASWDMAD